MRGRFTDFIAKVGLGALIAILAGTFINAHAMHLIWDTGWHDIGVMLNIHSGPHNIKIP